jgi:hypothetical protein
MLASSSLVVHRGHGGRPHALTHKRLIWTGTSAFVWSTGRPINGAGGRGGGRAGSPGWRGRGRADPHVPVSMTVSTGLDGVGVGGEVAAVVPAGGAPSGHPPGAGDRYRPVILDLLRVVQVQVWGGTRRWQRHCPTWPARVTARPFRGRSERRCCTRCCTRAVQPDYSLSYLLVGVAGFEPTAFRSQSGRATKLRYTPSPVRRSPGTPVPGSRTRRRGVPLSTEPAAGTRLRGRGTGSSPRIPGLTRASRGCSSMVELQPSKLVMRVRFPSPAP